MRIEIPKLDNCGQIWSPSLLAGGRLPRGYWKCPRGLAATRDRGTRRLSALARGSAQEN